MKATINFKNFEEVKAAYPVDSLLDVRGQTIQITGYQYELGHWWPINVVEGFREEIKEVLTNDM